MGLLDTFVPVEMDGLTLGLNQPNLPITGVAISTFRKRSQPTRILVLVRKQEQAQQRAKNPVCRTQIP